MPSSGMKRNLIPALIGGVIALTAPLQPAAASERVDELIRLAQELDPDVARGKVLYQKNCSTCHGPKALGSAPQLIPSLAAQRQAYLIKQLADFSEGERGATEMHVVVTRKAVNDPQAWADLAAYMNGLPPTNFPQQGSGAGLAERAEQYERWCASCHGDDGRGDDDGFAPSLRNQHYAYLVQQMGTLMRSHRANIDPNLAEFMDRLEPDEVQGLADYIARMRGPVRDRTRLGNSGVAGD